jgi:hypothetical protein
MRSDAPVVGFRHRNVSRLCERTRRIGWLELSLK